MCLFLLSLLFLLAFTEEDKLKKQNKKMLFL